MEYNTDSIEAVATTESNLVMQKGYVEDINSKTFTAILFDEDGEAEFRVKIPKKDGVSLHIGKMLNFYVDESSDTVVEFFEFDSSDNLKSEELSNQENQRIPKKDGFIVVGSDKYFAVQGTSVVEYKKPLFVASFGTVVEVARIPVTAIVKVKEVGSVLVKKKSEMPKHSYKNRSKPKIFLEILT